MPIPPKRVLVTGAAGFIGFHVSRRLLEAGAQVLGIDNLNSYYDPALKKARLAILEPMPAFAFERISLEDRGAVAAAFERFQPQRVLHLAAQAGVRYSLTHPHAYIDSNLSGTLTVLEGCRALKVEHLVFASSSSVYGGNTRMPYSEHDNVDHPVSLYAATKKATELMAHAYSHLFGIPATGLRFFTVYGPWGRPDMAYFSFTNKIIAGDPIEVFNFGKHRRDFTYIDDAVEAIARVLDRPPAPDASWSPQSPDPASSWAPYRVYNIGNNQPVELTRLIEILEREVGKPAVKTLLPAQPGDVEATWADVEALDRELGWKPRTPIEEGLRRFVAWYRQSWR